MQHPWEACGLPVGVAWGPRKGPPKVQIATDECFHAHPQVLTKRASNAAKKPSERPPFFGMDPSATLFQMFRTHQQQRKANAQTCTPSRVHPQWQVWVSHDDPVNQTVLNDLQEMSHVKLYNVEDLSLLPPWIHRSLSPSTWRFWAASNASTDAWVVRDCDSLSSAQEFAPVQEWLNSEKAFHLLIDHPGHHPHLASPINTGPLILGRAPNGSIVARPKTNSESIKIFCGRSFCPRSIEMCCRMIRTIVEKPMPLSSSLSEKKAKPMGMTHTGTSETLAAKTTDPRINMSRP